MRYSVIATTCRHWLSSHNRPTLAPRWVPFNGGLGDQQTQWLRHTLHEAKQRGDRVVIFSHIPVNVEVSVRLGRELGLSFAPCHHIADMTRPDGAGRAFHVHHLRLCPGEMSHQTECIKFAVNWYKRHTLSADTAHDYGGGMCRGVHCRTFPHGLSAPRLF